MAATLGKPLASWREAFKPQSLATLMDRHKTLWKRWDICFPRTPDVPGGRYASMYGQLRMLRGWILSRAGDAARGSRGAERFSPRCLAYGLTARRARTGLPDVLLFLAQSARINVRARRDAAASGASPTHCGDGYTR
ncbi:MAG: hypothetical protein IPP90_10590 [Gemmatimonadaceae bacterium]|nr:hypothetical protein [Gemmatimonadaceae bacterium]